MKNILFVLSILLLSFSASAQFRMVGTAGTWTSLGGGSYSATVTFSSDLTGNSYLPNQITNTFYLVTGSATTNVLQEFTITSATNLTFSMADLVVSQVSPTSSAPSGLVMVFNPATMGGFIPQVPFASAGATGQLQAAVDTYNARKGANTDYVTTDSFSTFSPSVAFSAIPIGKTVWRTTTGSKWQKTSSTTMTKRSTNNGLLASTIANTSNDTIVFNARLNNRVQMSTGNVSAAWVLDPLYYTTAAVGDTYTIGVQAGTSAVTVNWSALYGLYTGTTFTSMPTTIVPAQSVMTFTFRVITTSAEIVKFQYVDGISNVSSGTFASEIRDTVTQTSHGFTIPTHGFIPVRHNGTNWVAANSTSSITVHQAFIVAVPSVNTFILQQVGAIQKSSHGLTVGSVYYLQDNGTIAATPDADGDIAGDNIDPVCIATSSDRIMLLDRGSAGDSVAPSDSLFRSNEKLIVVHGGNTADADTVDVYQPIVPISGTAAPGINQSLGESFVIDGTGQTDMTISYSNLKNNKPLKLRVVNSAGLVTVPSTTIYYTEMGDLCIINPIDADNFTLSGYADGTFFYVDNISAAVNCLAFNSTYDSVLLRATQLGYTKPSIGVQVKQNALVVALKSANIWYKFDVFYYLKNDGSRQFAWLNWRDPWGDDNLTEVGTVTWTAADGFSSNGLQSPDVNASCLNTNFNPVTEGVKWTQNNMSMGVTVANPGATNSRYNMGIGNLRIEERTGTGWQYLANNTADQTQSGTGPATRIIVRTTSSATQAYTNATQTGTGTSTSAAPSSANMYIMAFNLSPPFGATATTVKYPGMVFMGAALNSTEVTNLINAYTASL